MYPMMEPTGALMSWVTVNINFSRETKRSSALFLGFFQLAAVMVAFSDVTPYDDEKIMARRMAAVAMRPVVRAACFRTR